MTPYYQNASVTIYHGDCREIVPQVTADCLITDPPWGLGELSGTIAKERNRNAYASHDDTEEYVRDVVVPVIRLGLTHTGGRGVITPGVPCMFFYDRPRAIGGFYQPAAVGMCPWGFTGYNPVLYYGKDPRDGKGQSNVMRTLTERASTDKHPCAKPLSAMLWLVEKGTLSHESVLDPFMGSGTTLVAAQRLNRRCIGIEIDERYCEMAARRCGSMATADEDEPLLGLMLAGDGERTDTITPAAGAHPALPPRPSPAVFSHGDQGDGR